MAILRTTTLAAAAGTLAATVSARDGPGSTLWELTNSTAAVGRRPHEAFDPRIYSFCGVDLTGGDIWQARHPGPDACVANCIASTGCDAATWTNYEGGTCFFKRLQGSWASAVPRVGAVSFLRIDNNPGRYMGPNFPPNVDMPGNDIGSSLASRPTDCIRICQTNAFCFAYTWTSYNGGTCWLKKKASPFVPSPGTTSDFTGRWTNPDTCLA
jgi:hypothetical protein